MERLLSDITGRYRACSKRCVRCGCCRTPRYSDEQWRLIESLYGLLPLALAQLALSFPPSWRGGFHRASDRREPGAGRAGCGRPISRSALDYRIRHLLVDEFQDTSFTQCELLHKLTAGWQPGDGRTLFPVGDPMQSIYRFRQAEVGLFLRARNTGIGAVELEAFTLATNFRSQARHGRMGQRRFARVLPARGSCERRRTLCGFDAAHVAELRATRWCASVPHSTGAAEVRLVTESRAGADARMPGGIAILVRNRRHLTEIVPRLKGAGCGFRAIEIEALAHRPVVQDLHALTRAFCILADRWRGSRAARAVVRASLERPGAPRRRVPPRKCGRSQRSGARGRPSQATRTGATSRASSRRSRRSR